MNKRDYTGYVNPKLNDSNKIFTREEIAKMPRAEFAANEKAIDYQLGTIGIPSENDLQGSSGVVHVRAYTKGDGTDVREHYRSAPNRQSNTWGMGVDEDKNNKPDSDEDKTPAPNPKPTEDPNTDKNPNPKTPDPENNSGDVLKGGIVINEYNENAKGSIPYLAIAIAIGALVLTAVKIAAAIAGTKSQQTISGSPINAIEINNNSSERIKTHQARNVQIQNYKAQLVNIIKESRTLLEKQKSELQSFENKIAKNNNQSVHKQLWAEYSANKSLYQDNKAKIDKLENMVNNNQFQEIARDYKNSYAEEGGGGNPKSSGNDRLKGFRPLSYNWKTAVQQSREATINDLINYGLFSASFAGVPGIEEQAIAKALPIVGKMGQGALARTPLIRNVYERLSEKAIIKFIEEKVAQMPKVYKGRPSNPSLYKEKLYRTYYTLKNNGYLVNRHAVPRIVQRINQGKISSVEKILEVLKKGHLYYDPVENNYVRYADNVAVIIDRYTGEIVNAIGRGTNPYWILKK